ncbi:MAG: DUF1365 domain-containing protein [Pseudomonadota bacterium]
MKIQQPKPLTFYKARVYHARNLPVKNKFSYHVNYLIISLLILNKVKSSLWFGYNTKALLSLYDQDYAGAPDYSLLSWAKHIIAKYNIPKPITAIELITLPRVWGYQFNPVSFYCLYNKQHLLAVIAEVHNHHEEKHSYLCYNKNYTPITSATKMTADKVFQVSPFFDRNGYYEFKFMIKANSFNIKINYFNPQQQLQLATQLVAQRISFVSAKWWYLLRPWQSVKAIALIYWQALKLKLKNVRYRRRLPVVEY